jgi:hypothetical protein
VDTRSVRDRAIDNNSFRLTKLNIKRYRDEIQRAQAEITRLQANVSQSSFALNYSEIANVDSSEDAVKEDKQKLSIYLENFFRHNQEAFEIDYLNIRIMNFIDSLQNDEARAFFESIPVLDTNGFNSYQALASAYHKAILEKLVGILGENNRSILTQELANIGQTTTTQRVMDAILHPATFLNLKIKMSVIWQAIQDIKPVLDQTISAISIRSLDVGEIHLYDMLALETDSQIEFRILLTKAIGTSPSSLLRRLLVNYLSPRHLPALLQTIVADMGLFNEYKSTITNSKRINVLTDVVKKAKKNLEIEIENLKIIAVRLVRIHATFALHQKMYPLLAYSGYVNYSALMHWWHHSRLFSQSFENTFILDFLSKLYEYDVNDLDATVKLIEDLFNRHDAPASGLTTNAYDTFFLESLFNAGVPSGLIYLYRQPDNSLLSAQTHSLLTFETYDYKANHLKHDLGFSEAKKPSDIVITGCNSQLIRGQNSCRDAGNRHRLFRLAAVIDLRLLADDIRTASMQI